MNQWFQSYRRQGTYQQMGSLQQVTHILGADFIIFCGGTELLVTMLGSVCKLSY